MLKTLHSRLILSHILPLLITLPLMGIGLIYVLETQVYLPALSAELENDTRLFVQLAAAEENLWQNPSQAQALVNLYSARDNVRMMLLEPDGRQLASNNAKDQANPDEALDGADFAAVLSSLRGDAAAGTIIHQVHFSSRLNAEVIDIFAPVRDSGQVLGFVRISYPFSTVTNEIYQLRFLIAALVVIGLLLGSGLGYALAVSVANPVQEVTRAISALAQNSQMKLLNVYGPEEIRSLTQSANNLVSRLRELEQARRHLLANLVHEIGRPLGAIRSAVTALGQGAERDPELYQDLVKGMDGETRRMQRLLNDLSGLYDQILGTIDLDRSPIDLGEWLSGALTTWQAAAAEKGILWELTEPGQRLVVNADPNRLAQIVGNLASNAIKFCPPGGKVSVSAVISQNQVGIAIRDTGPGMSPEELEKIFQPFYQGSQGRRFRQGMGLGLSIARDLIEAHGGRLTVESDPGQGSCFTAWLPFNPT